MASQVSVILREGIESLVNNADRMDITIDTVPILSGMINAATVLMESAEAVAYSLPDEKSRTLCFDYAAKIKGEMEFLQRIIAELSRGIYGNHFKPQIINSLLKIGRLTSSLVDFEEDKDRQALNEAARHCAKTARELMYAAQNPDQTALFDAARNFASSTLTLIKSVTALAVKYPEHREKLSQIENSLKNLSPRMIEAIKESQKDINNRVTFQKVSEITKELAKYISQALHALERDQPPSPLPPTNTPAPAAPIPEAQPLPPSDQPSVVPLPPSDQPSVVPPVEEQTSVPQVTDSSKDSSWSGVDSATIRRKSRMILGGRGPTATDFLLSGGQTQSRDRSRTITTTAEGRDVLRRARGATLQLEIEAELFKFIKEKEKQEQQGAQVQTVTDPKLEEENKQLKAQLEALSRENEQLHATLSSISALLKNAGIHT